MDINELTAFIQGSAGKMPQMGKSLKLNLDEGTIHIDLTGEEAVVSNDDKEANCTISTNIATLQGLRDGSVNPMSAMMTGKVKVKGDMGLAMKLQSLLA